ncbi:hypothetical protein OROGR_002890 [Orobanche gracilis]
MEGRWGTGLIATVLCLGVFVGFSYAQGNTDDITGVYIVTLKQAPTSHYHGELRVSQDRYVKRDGPEIKSRFDKSRGLEMKINRLSQLKIALPALFSAVFFNVSRMNWHGSYVDRVHSSLLKSVLRGEKYLKLYSYHYLINGFAVLVTPQQADKLSRRAEVSNVVLDFSVRTATTHTPQFLGLTQGAWARDGGFQDAGEGVVIGFIDTGIDPTHPSFSDVAPEKPYSIPQHFSGVCEVTQDFPSGSCNRKLIGARHFAASAITRGMFNTSQEYASPFDADGHGTHTASVAAGNHGIGVVVAGNNFGNASGMAPRSQLYTRDLEALLQMWLLPSIRHDRDELIMAAQDGVDIISLSITPNRRPLGIATFFNPIDMALLSAVKSGIFVVQAAGNTGPSPGSMSSFSPWIYTVGAASHDRVYSNSIVLGNSITIPGVGLAPGTDKDAIYTLVSAIHGLKNTTPANDMYISECQDPSNFDQDLIQGKLLMCSYSVRFVLGIATIKQALETAKNLGAAGVVFSMDPYVIGFQLNPIPMTMPGIIIPTQNDSRVLLEYYNSTLDRDKVTNKIVKFRGIASISGGIKANFSRSAPKIMYYSARGPDPEDSSLDDADILKPNIVAPGNLIWAGWSSIGTDSEFQGESFAMMSGTSMAAPHLAGLAALIKQIFPFFSPASIGSALSTTASLYDRNGAPIMAQRAYANPDLNQYPATPFDMGSGFVNATAALDPGLVFDSSYNDYMSFLCGINGSSPVVLNYTGESCTVSTMNATDLNLPSITISKLNHSATVRRTVTNIASNETYSIGWSPPYGVSVEVTPTRFFIASGQKQVLSISINATMNSSTASFGRIGLFGSQGHVANVPLSVIVKISYSW